jgi:hypothetical protein
MFSDFAIVNFTPLASLGGGLLIGFAALWMMASQGRVAGISGICGGLLSPSERSQIGWRVMFLLGLLLAGFTASSWVGPEVMSYGLERSQWVVIAAGVLVGFGTRMGSGCTSGHGVCGLGRLSPRSMAATGTFMGVGMIVAAIVTHGFGGQL